MGTYEEFIIKQQLLNHEQCIALKEYGVIITSSERTFKKRCEDDESTLLLKNYKLKSYITATRIRWKEDFRDMLREQKIRYRTKMW